MRDFDFISFNQPIGTYYFVKIKASELLEIYDIRRRKYTGDKGTGIQRSISDSRVKDIADYVMTSDATFPTAIIAGVDEENISIVKGKIRLTGKLDIIDGQHRIEGLNLARKNYGDEAIEDFELPLVITIEPTEEQKAYVFATINGNQAKVDKSLIYDLFGISDNDLDPFTFTHKVARTLNYSKNSPFHGKLKMLGKKSEPDSDEILSQGTFVKTLLDKISKKPFHDREVAKTTGELEPIDGLAFREFYRNSDVKALVSLLATYFSTISKTFPTEWNDPQNYILLKTTGYVGFIRGIDSIIELKKSRKVTFEKACELTLTELKSIFKKEKLELTKDFFLPGATGQKKIKDKIEEAVSNL